MPIFGMRPGSSPMGSWNCPGGFVRLSWGRGGMCGRKRCSVIPLAIMNMTDPEFYYTIERTGSAEFKDRGSRFIAFALPVASTADAKLALNEVKKEHPKAT